VVYRLCGRCMYSLDISKFVFRGGELCGVSYGFENGVDSRLGVRRLER
jgi:hypothetical protein